MQMGELLQNKQRRDWKHVETSSKWFSVFYESSGPTEDFYALLCSENMTNFSWKGSDKIKLALPTKKLFNKDSRPWHSPAPAGFRKDYKKCLVSANDVSFHSGSAEVIICGVFQSVPGIRDYSSNAVLAPIVSVTKHRFIRPAGERWQTAFEK